MPSAGSGLRKGAELTRDDRMWRDLQPDRHKPEGHWKHWTNQGTFELKSDIANGTLVYELWFRGRIVTSFFEIRTAISQVLDGTLDGDLGISGKSSGLPQSLRDWNGFM